MAALYSGSLLLRSGSLWMRFTGAVEEALVRLLEVRFGEPPAHAEKQNLLLVAFLLEGSTGLGEGDEALEAEFLRLVAILNGLRSSFSLVHYCSGASCCAEGKPSTIVRLVPLIMRTLLRQRPVIPQLSRWSKPVECLDFFLGGVTFGMLLVNMLGTLMEDESLAADDACDKMRQMTLSLDPEAFMDHPSGFRALRGTRLKKTFETLRSKRSFSTMWLLVIFLGGQRYVNKFLQATVRSVRVRAARSGHTVRPPVLDLANPEYSPVEVVQQFYSSLLSIGEEAGTTTLCGILLEIAARTELTGEYTKKATV